MERSELPTLSYANQPVFENLIVARRPDGIAITALPHPRYVRRQSLKLGGAIVLWVLAVGCVGYLWLVENKEYQRAVAISISVGFVFTLPVFLKLLVILRTFSIDADAGGIRFGHPGAAKWQWLVKSAEREVQRAHILDLVATRVIGRPPSAGHTFFLQLRLHDGENVNLGFGTEVEIRWLTEHIGDALQLKNAFPNDGKGGDIAPP